MAGFIVQSKELSGEMSALPLVGDLDIFGNEIIDFYASKERYNEVIKMINLIKTKTQFIKSPLGNARLEETPWIAIDLVSRLGLADSCWSIGDEKSVLLSTGQTIKLVIMGFNHDKLVDGGRAGITFGMKDTLATDYPMNVDITNAGGWDSSGLRNQTMPLLLEQLPSDLKTYVKTVVKSTTAGNMSTSIINSNDKLFLFSLKEITNNDSGNAGCGLEGEQYEYWRTIKDGTVAADRVKNVISGWWLRTPKMTDTVTFMRCLKSGAFSNSGAVSASSVSYGLCV